MPLPDSNFVAVFPLQEQIVDKTTGGPLSAGVITFYEDDSRTVLKPIYQQSLSPSNEYVYTQLNNPITLTSIGTMADDNGNDIIPFLYPYEGLPTDPVRGDIQLYYITVYAADPPAGDAALQFTREAWPPGLVSGDSPTDTFEASENQVANPQFVEVSFTPDLTSGEYVFSVSGTGTVTPFAPDWSLVTSGTGTVTLKQVAITDTTAPSNPPYVLDIDSASITSLKIRQRLTNSPRLFANGFVSSYFVARSQDAGSHALSLAYVPSDSPTGSSYVLASGATTSDNAYVEIFATEAIDGTINTDAATTGYVDIELTLPVTAHVQLSSFQIAAVQNASSRVPFLAQSTPMQINNLYHDDREPIFYKPIPSLLTAWDFQLNPAQINSAGNVPAQAASAYIWDQTIAGFATATTGTVAYASNTITSGIQFTTASAAVAWYVMQYLSGGQAKKFLGTRLSSNVNGFRTTAGGSVVGRIYLCRASSAATFPTLPTYIGTISNVGVFSISAANWTIINRGDFGTPSFHFPEITTNADIEQDTLNTGFSGWEITDATQIADTDKFAIVTTFYADTPATVVTVNSISVVPGDIPTAPAPQTFDDVLRECRYYYEKSYEIGVAPGTVSATNQRTYAYTAFFNPSGPTSSLVFESFEVSYQKKRTNPTIVLYSPLSATAARVAAGLSLNGTYGPGQATFNASNWTLQNQGTESALYRSQDTNTAQQSVGSASLMESVVSYHFTADARLGVV